MIRVAILSFWHVHAAGYAFAFAPVAINSIALVSIGMFCHRTTGHSYPHHAPLPAKDIAAMREAAGFQVEDIDKALDEMPDSIDISREDLDLLLARAEILAQARRAVG